MEDQSRATTASDNAHSETRYTEAEALEAGDSLDSNRHRYGATSPALAVRQVRLRNRLGADAVGVPRSCTERVGGQTTRCGSGSRGRSRRSTTEPDSSDGQRLVVRQVCHGCHGKQGGSAGRATDSCHRSYTATCSDGSQDYIQSATSVEHSDSKGFSRGVCDHGASRQVDCEPKVPFPRRCSDRS